MRLGGEPVAEVFRRLPAAKWIAAGCDVRIGSVRPFQSMVNLAYQVLDDIRPLLGCDRCGKSNPWVRAVRRLTRKTKAADGLGVKPAAPLHFNPLPAPPKLAAGYAHQTAAVDKG